MFSLTWKMFSDSSVEQDGMAAELNRILAAKLIRTVFQPVVSLGDGTVLGYEALSRGPAGSPLERPDALFEIADKQGLVWELDYLCRTKALEHFGEMQAGFMAFLNIDPRVFNDPRFKKGLTKEVLDSHGLTTADVILEITEKAAIDDIRHFRRVLDNYVSQGYKVAIDDTGAGYSGLRLLAQMHPQYIKVDMELVRDIDKDGLKQSMMKALYDFSVMANSRIIAEGIETEEELNTLIDIGIPYGQGYFLRRPAAEFQSIPSALREMIVSRNEQKRRAIFDTPLTTPIGEISRRDYAFSPQAPGAQVLDYFNAHPNILGIPVVNQERPVGLLMKNRFLACLATQYGVAVYMNRPIGLLMEHRPLIVDADTPLEQVAKFALARTDESIYDYILVTRNGEYYGTTTVKRLLEKLSQMEVIRARHSNPLTGLPGNVLIEEQLKQSIESGSPYSVLYFDLDNFKAFNDVYGFESGDKVLCFTARVIRQSLDDYGYSAAFLGHVGGDDFVVIIPTYDVSAVCEQIIEAFDARISDYFTSEDKQSGFIVTVNRHGVSERYPLTTLSIAVVSNAARTFTCPEELGEVAVKVKKQCKMTWESCYRLG